MIWGLGALALVGVNAISPLLDTSLLFPVEPISLEKPLWDTEGDNIEALRRDIAADVDNIGARRRLGEFDIEEKDLNYWKVDIGFDPTRMDKVSAAILVEWGKSQKKVSGEISIIGDKAGKSLESLKKIEDNLQKIYGVIGDGYRGKMQDEVDNIKNKFIQATNDLWSAELKAMNVIRKCIRMTYNTWNMVYQNRLSPDDMLEVMVGQAQRSMDGELQAMLKTIDDLLEQVDWAINGRPGTDGGFVNIDKIIDKLYNQLSSSLGKSESELSEAYEKMRSHREKYERYMKAGHWSWLSIPLTAGIPVATIVLYSVAAKEADLSRGLEKIREKLEIVSTANGHVHTAFKALKAENLALWEHGRKLENFMEESRSDMAALANIIVGGHLAHGKGNKRAALAGWRFAIPDHMCRTVQDMWKGYNRYVKNHDQWDKLDDKYGTCKEIGKQVWAPTPMPTNADPLIKCLLEHCGKRALTSKVIRDDCMQHECKGIEGLPTPPPSVPPPRDAACDELAALTKSTICKDGKAFLILAAGDDNYSMIEGGQSACLPGGANMQPQRRTHWSGIRILTVHKFKNGGVVVDVDANDFTMSTTDGGDPVPYGTAGDCYKTDNNCDMGSFSIDLRLTGFEIEEHMNWGPKGFGGPKAEVTVSESSVKGRCGHGARQKNQCGGCAFSNTNSPFDRSGKRILKLRFAESVDTTQMDPECYEKNVNFYSRVFMSGPKPKTTTLDEGKKALQWRECCDFTGVETAEECNALAHLNKPYLDQQPECTKIAKEKGFCPIYWTHSPNLNGSCQLFINKGQPYWMKPEENVTSGSTVCYKDHLKKEDDGMAIRCHHEFGDNDEGQKSLKYLTCGERRWAGVNGWHENAMCGRDFLVGVCTSGGSRNCPHDTNPKRKYPKVALCQRAGTGIFQRGDGQPKYPIGEAKTVLSANPGKKISCDVKNGWSAIGMCSSGGMRDCFCKTEECDDKKKRYSHSLVCRKGLEFKQEKNVLERKLITGWWGKKLACPYGFVMYAMCASLRWGTCWHGGKPYYAYIECARVHHPLSVEESFTITEIMGHWHRIAIGYDPKRTVTASVFSQTGETLTKADTSKFGISSQVTIGVQIEQKTSVSIPNSPFGGVTAELGVTGKVDKTSGNSREWIQEMRKSTNALLRSTQTDTVESGCPKVDQIQCMYRWRQGTTLANGKSGPTVETNIVMCIPGCTEIPVCHPDDCVDQEKCTKCKSDDIISWTQWEFGARETIVLDDAEIGEIGGYVKWLIAASVCGVMAMAAFSVKYVQKKKVEIGEEVALLA